MVESQGPLELQDVAIGSADLASQPSAGPLPIEPPPPSSSTRSSNAAERLSHMVASIRDYNSMSTEQLGKVLSAINDAAKEAGTKIKVHGDEFFDQNTWTWKMLAIFLALWGMFVPTALTIHYSGPANQIAQQSLMESEWANYYTWVWTVCPAEQVRLDTLLDCDGKY